MDQSYDPEERFNVFRFLSHLVQPQDVTHQAAFKAGPQKLFVLATPPPDKRSQLQPECHPGCSWYRAPRDTGRVFRQFRSEDE